jgi:hypothetical protein
VLISRRSVVEIVTGFHPSCHESDDATLIRLRVNFHLRRKLSCHQAFYWHAIYMMAAQAWVCRIYDSAPSANIKYAT